MTPRQDLENTLKGLLEKAERQLMAIHNAGEVLPVIARLRQLLRSLDFSTHRRSVALLASEQTGKICYMDTEVEPQLVIDKPLRTRDLADYRKKEKEYLVMVLDRDLSRTYLGRDSHLRLIKSNTPQSVQSNHFIHHMDQGLGGVLKVYPLPVFVIGPDPVTDFFTRITKHEEQIVDYIHQDVTDMTENRLLEWLRPQLVAWDSLRQRMVRQQIEKALKTGRLICGLDNVRKTAGSKNNRLLVIPRDSTRDSSRGTHPFYKASIIDDIAEKVFANGGEVEKVEKDMLNGYDDIAIVRYC